MEAGVLLTKFQMPSQAADERVAILCSPRCSRDWEEELRYLGVQADRTHDWQGLLHRLQERSHAAVVLVEEFLGVDVLRLGRAIRVLEPACLLILIGGRHGGIEEVLGLELGADLVLPPDASARLIVAHLNAQRRRRPSASTALSGNESLRFGELEIRRSERAVYLRGERVALSSGEFELLNLLASRAGEVVPHEEVLRRLRGLSVGAEDRSMDARLYRLRKRFGNTEEVKHRLRSVRPNGYMFTNTEWT